MKYKEEVLSKLSLSMILVREALKYSEKESNEQDNILK